MCEEETAKAIKALKTGKAGGEDDIKPEIIIYLGDEGVTYGYGKYKGGLGKKRNLKKLAKRLNNVHLLKRRACKL